MCTSFWLGGEVAKLLSWRWAMILAGIPGLVIGVIAWFLPEPERAAPQSDEPSMYQVMRSLCLNPIMILLMISGAIHNFNMYAFAFFSSSYFQRFHGLDVKQAGLILGIAYGVGGLGILMGGWLCDYVASKRPGGRLEVSTLAIFLSVICYFLGLYCKAGLVYQSALCFLFSYLLSCIYYPGVYATIQDVTTPRQRGKAMAIYFCVMYLIGGSFGTSVTGWLSKWFSRQAALAMGVVVLKPTDMPPEAAAIGLRTAFFELPILSLVLAFVLLAAARLVAAQLRAKASSVKPRTEPA
jgi:MFS family permease